VPDEVRTQAEPVMRLKSGWHNQRVSRDLVASFTGAAVFSLALGMAYVALPLLALRAGYSVSQIGLLTAVSAAAQMSTRLLLGAAMRRWADWTLVAAAGFSLAASNTLVAISPALVPFLLAEALQGVARACFWTGSQTHVVRGPGPSMGALAAINLAAAVGLLIGPVLAGLLSADTPALALAVAGGVALAGTVPAFLLRRLPPFARPADRPPGHLWRRPGVDIGCWAGVTAGAWTSLLGSYVPVLLAAARHTTATIGVLVAVANGASIIGAVAIARLSQRRTRTAFLIGTLAAGLGLALTAVAAQDFALGAVALAVSGLGAGILQTIGPAIAADAVHPEERGEAIAVAGTFRAAALLSAPLAVAGLLGFVALVPAVTITGLAVTLPALAVRRTPGRRPAGRV
jgi:MFS family permease